MLHALPCRPSVLFRVSGFRRGAAAYSVLQVLLFSCSVLLVSPQKEGFSAAVAMTGAYCSGVSPSRRRFPCKSFRRSTEKTFSASSLTVRCLAGQLKTDWRTARLRASPGSLCVHILPCCRAPAQPSRPDRERTFVFHMESELFSVRPSLAEAYALVLWVLSRPSGGSGLLAAPGQRARSGARADAATEDEAWCIATYVAVLFRSPNA